jgi:hypothetical protein
MSVSRDPAYISFTDAAELLVRHGLAASMTPQGLRYIARSRSKRTDPPGLRWPFGNGPGQEPYLQAGRTRMMRTARLLKYFKEYPPTGRGPARKPRGSDS